MIKNRPREDLKKIALDIHKGLIFSDAMIREKSLFDMVFMVFIFMDQAARNKLLKDKPGMCFEYMEKAGPRSINGHPMFFSCQILNQGDTKHVLRMVKKLHDAEEKAKAQL